MAWISRYSSSDTRSPVGRTQAERRLPSKFRPGVQRVTHSLFLPLNTSQQWDGGNRSYGRQTSQGCGHRGWTRQRRRWEQTWRVPMGPPQQLCSLRCPLFSSMSEAVTRGGGIGSLANRLLYHQVGVGLAVTNCFENLPLLTSKVGTST